MNVHRSQSLTDAAAAKGEFRAGGTDVAARRRILSGGGDLIDIAAIPDLRGIRFLDDGGCRIGSMERISTVAADPELQGRYPALTATAGALANPHIRQVATIGGNLLQRTRCPYYRNPLIDCHKSGGEGCPAREGDHRHGVVFDTGPCIAPHPSSLAMALLLYEGTTVSVHGRESMTIADLYGDGSDPTRDHRLGANDLLVAVELPPATAGERAAYWRATGRLYAEWPIAEAAARLVISDGVVVTAAVAAGAVAPTPIRLPETEAMLEGRAVAEIDFAAVRSSAVSGATPSTQTAHKLDLLSGTVEHVVRAAIEGTPHTELALHERGLPQRI